MDNMEVVALSQQLRNGTIKIELLEDNGTINTLAYNGYYIAKNGNIILKVARDN